MLPSERIVSYFVSCGNGSVAEIASHFTDDAVIYDTNIRPIRGAAAIGEMWVAVRERWGGAQWTVESCVSNDDVAAIEWSMTGTDPSTNQDFIFRGSEHYAFVDTKIAEIRQYWTFDPDNLDTALVGYTY